MSDNSRYNALDAAGLRERLEMLNLSQRELGRWLGKDERTARRYVLGESKVSPELAILVNLLQDIPVLIRHVREKLGEPDPDEKKRRRWMRK